MALPSCWSSCDDRGRCQCHELGVRNSQPEGIGRVASFGDLVAWNNLGRNIVFADSELRPLAVFGSTRFGDQDELSQYDLDIHAVLAVPPRPRPGAQSPRASADLSRSHLADRARAGGASRRDRIGPADMERTVVAGSRLVGSRPRSEGAIGLVVSQPVEAAVDDAPLGADMAGEDLGEVTALGGLSDADAPLVVVGGPGKVFLVPLRGTMSGCRAGRWTCPSGRLLSSGMGISSGWRDRPRCRSSTTTTGIAPGRWFCGPRPERWHRRPQGALPDDVAWGTGGVAVVRSGAVLCAVGRGGAAHLLDLTTSSTSSTSSSSLSWRSTPALAPRSLGIAHAAVAGNRILYGFNRGGYRLWASVAESPGSERV